MAEAQAGTPRSIGFWLAVVDRLIGERVESTLTEHGVTRLQWQLLNALERGPADLISLGRAIAPFLPRGGGGDSMAEMLEELVDSGWVAADGEIFALTPTGQTIVLRLRAIVEEQRQQFSEGVSDDEYAQTLSVLERIARNLGWSEHS